MLCGGCPEVLLNLFYDVINVVVLNVGARLIL